VEITIKFKLALIFLKEILANMKKTFLLILLAVFILPVAEAKDVKVNGYYKSNGTYTQPHYRTSPNSTQSDNWSTFGNSNPQTGQSGSKPDRTYDPYRSIR
jgi:hypothetical protein